MLTAIFAALLFVVALLIIASFLVSAWIEHRRYKRLVANQSTLPAHPLDRHVTAVLHMQDGNIVSIEERKPAPLFSLPSSWYARRRSIVSLGLLVMILLAFCLQGGLAGGGGSIQSLAQGLGMSFLNPVPSSQIDPAARPLPQTPSARLQRVDSASREQYHNNYEWTVWSYSSCSGIAMEMVMNSYGRHLIASDVLQKELDLGVWDVNLGLLREEGIALTASSFGFDTDAGHTRTIPDIVAIANKGQPVIVSIRDAHYYPGGHLFVVRGGDDQFVSIADSSTANFQHMTYPMFEGMWQGFSAVLIPKSS